MKIAIDIRTAGGERTGKGWYTFHIVSNLLQIDTKNSYILYTNKGVAGFEQYKNAKMKIMDHPSAIWHMKVAKDVGSEGADIFFSPSSYITPALMPKTVKTILTVHDLVAFLFPNTHNKKATLIEKITLKRALKKSAHVVTVSQNTKKDLLKKFKYDSDKISIVPCAGSEEFKPLEKEKLGDFIEKTNLPPKFFLAVGTIEPRKNYPGLIKAFAELNKIYPDVHLIVVGQKGWGYEEFFNLIRKNYLNKKVHTLGYLSNESLMKLYSLSQALVFPSFYEGFGIPPLEAMRCGCPVIASDKSSVPEVVGDSAILINPENPKEITAAMVKILTDSNLRKGFSEKGLEQAKKFSWRTSAEKLLEILKTEQGQN